MLCTGIDSFLGLQFAMLFQNFLHDIVVSETHSVGVFY